MTKTKHHFGRLEFKSNNLKLLDKLKLFFYLLFNKKIVFVNIELIVESGMIENELALLCEVASPGMFPTTVLTSNILCNWPRERIVRFAKHLLGDKCQECRACENKEAIATTEERKT